jgi:drug/metabolite transporter (DMT)-like permease
MSVETTSGSRPAKRAVPGALVAGATAVVSGVSVFVNSYGVHAVTSPAVYTTAKNVVASGILALAAFVGFRARARARGTAASNFVDVASTSADGADCDAPARAQWGRWLGLAYVGVFGGGLAFVLFFNGLAQSEPASAAFWRDTMVLWVALIAVPVLRERIRWWNVLAVVMLFVGEVTMTGGVGQLGAHRGEFYVLGATVIWALEVVVAKRLLRELAPATLALVRMGVGALALVAYLGITGALPALFSLDGVQLRWALVTGVLLALYVATWMTALARARALDVTSVLVGSVLVTWTLQVVAGTTSPAPASLGLVLIALGVGLVVRAGLSRSYSAGRRPEIP